MDWYHLYEAARHRSLTQAERQALDAILEKYPYFALPHALQARLQPEPERVFIAATYAANRSLLRQALQKPQPVEPVQASAMPIEPPQEQPVAPPSLPVSLPQGTPRYWHAPFVGGMDVALAAPVTVVPTQALAIGRADAPAELPGYAWLQATVVAHTCRCLRLIAQVQTQLRRPVEPVEAEDPADIFDRFLASRPRRPRPTPPLAGEPETHAVARESVVPDDELVTETLALLHLRQHNHQEAARIYEKLRLRYPEKSAYFEAQIRKIKLT